MFVGYAQTFRELTSVDNLLYYCYVLKDENQLSDDDSGTPAVRSFFPSNNKKNNVFVCRLNVVFNRLPSFEASTQKARNRLLLEYNDFNNRCNFGVHTLFV